VKSQSLFDLSGRVAVVVGGTSGIGRALALGLADAGADVVATGRRESLVKDVSAEIEKRGRRSLAIPCDVEDAGSLERVREACLSTLGGVDILVAAAGRTKRIASAKMTDEEWDQIIETNLTGVFRACRVFAAPMLAKGYGRIVTIASLASFVGLHEVAAYTASKAGVAGLTRALAVEWARQGVTVNAIAPGVFKTDLNRALIESPRGQEFIYYSATTELDRYGFGITYGGALMGRQVKVFINVQASNNPCSSAAK